MTTTPPDPDDYEAAIQQSVDAALADLSAAERAELDDVVAAHRAAWEQRRAEEQVLVDEIQRRGRGFRASWEQVFRAAAGTDGGSAEIRWGEPARPTEAAGGGQTVPS